MRKAMQTDNFFISLLALAFVALFTVPALAAWLGPERAHPAAQQIMDEDFVTESGMTTTYGVELKVVRDFIAPAP